MRLMALALILGSVLIAGCSQGSVAALEAGAGDAASQQAVRGLRQERRLILAKHEKELRNAESIYASANGISLRDVKDNPTAETVQGVEQLRLKIRSRRDRYLQEIDAEIAKHAASPKAAIR